MTYEIGYSESEAANNRQPPFNFGKTLYPAFLIQTTSLYFMFLSLNCCIESQCYGY